MLVFSIVFALESDVREGDSSTVTIFILYEVSVTLFSYVSIAPWNITHKHPKENITIKQLNEQTLFEKFITLNTNKLSCFICYLIIIKICIKYTMYKVLKQNVHKLIL